MHYTRTGTLILGRAKLTSRVKTHNGTDTAQRHTDTGTPDSDPDAEIDEDID